MPQLIAERPDLPKTKSDESVFDKPFRRTKIVCTVGPACEEESQLRRLIESGVNVFRLNFSHADHRWHTRVIDRIRSQATQLQTPIGVLQDLCGPKIRISHVAPNAEQIEAGDQLRITTDWHIQQKMVSEDRYDLATTYQHLIEDLEVGDSILLDDGRIELEVDELLHNVVHATAKRGSSIHVGKGMNLPGVDLSTDSMTQKDWDDLQWGLIHKVDFFALSFVRRAEDLAKVRSRLEDVGSTAQLIAKIERPEAVQNFPAILKMADALMIARGDLGLETDLTRVPILQKRLIECCRQAGKPVITATQMLESMVHDSTPTRAEISDVANAIYDGSDAVMLSGETAAGRFPERAVAVLRDVAIQTEPEVLGKFPEVLRTPDENTAVEALVETAAEVARRMDARRIVVFTRGGYTARRLARRRFPTPIVAATNSPETYRQLCLLFGVEPVFLPHVVNIFELRRGMNKLSGEFGWAKPGENLVLIGGLQDHDYEANTMHVHQVEPYDLRHD